MAKPEVTVIKVTMLDGREVEFPGKRRMLKEAKIDGNVITICIDFINGEARKFVLPESLLLQFAAHGGLQKYGDATSGIDDIDKMVDAVDDVDETVQSGSWNAIRDASAGSLAGASILAKALVVVTGQPIEVVRSYLATLDAKTKTALRFSAEVAPAVKKLEDEKAARAAARGKTVATIDVSATLAGLKAAGSAPAQPASAFSNAPV